MAIGLDAIRDADHDRDQTDGESGVPPPVDLGGMAFAEVS